MEEYVEALHLRAECGQGFGIAACPSHRLLAAGGSDGGRSFVRIWKLLGRGLVLQWELGGFVFCKEGMVAGCVAFLPGRPMLLVSDCGEQAVHVIDAVSGVRRGQVAKVQYPRGLAASGALVAAVSGWKTIRLYREGEEDHVWVHVWSLPQVRYYLFGLRFSRDGSTLAVACGHSGCFAVLDVGTGQVVESLPSAEFVTDGQEVVQGTWMLAHGNRVSGGGCGFPVHCASGVAMVPGFGLVARGYDDGLHVFSTPDLLALWDMSPLRIAWMGAVAAK